MSELHAQPNEISDIIRQGSQLLMAEQPARVVALIAPALEKSPDNVGLLNLYGVALMRTNRFAGAAKVFDHSLEIQPEQHLPAYNRGISLQQTGDFPGALISFRMAVANKPDFIQALNMAAIMQLKLGRVDDAIASYDAAIARAPNQALLYSNRGGLRLSRGQTELALQDFDRALQIDPNFADSWRNRGQIMLQQGRFSEALASYERSIKLQPKFPQNYLLHGTALARMNRNAGAIESLSHAISLKPDFAAAWRQRGIVYRTMKEPDRAIADFKKAIAFEPDNPEGHNLLGNVLAQEARFTEAMPHYDKAIALKPDFAWAYNNRGNAHKELGDIAAAEADFDKAMEIDNKTPVFRWNKSLLTLLKGDFAHGWAAFESRWERRIIHTAQENLQYPRWNGETDIAGKTILLHAEQGLGDTIQFCRYAPMVAALGAKVVLSVQPALIDICRSLPEEITVTTQGRDHGHIDLQCPLMSLPGAFHTDLGTIPAEVPYLRPAKKKVSEWAKRLGKRKRPRIGLVWSGNAGLLPDKSRSIPAEQFRALTELPFEFHSLQKEIRGSDIAALSTMGGVIRHEGGLNDFSDTAALIENLDLVISVDTSVAHMAGAIGKPLWLLTPLAPDWRWLLGRTDSPWYPTARLFRQQEKGNWSDLLADVAAELIKHF